MAPKKGKKKNKYDEQFEQEQQYGSKWAKALGVQKEEQEGDAEEVYRKQKSTFDYDFTNSNYLPEDKPIEHKDKYADLTQEEKQLIKQIEEKQKQDKEKKQKIKNEKRKERKKELDIQKQKQKIEKQKQLEEDKKVQQEIKKIQTKSNGCMIPIFLLLFIIIMGFLQYQTELHAKLAKFKLGNEDNYYQVLEVDEGSTDKEVKAKYKKLVLKYHPDRNPDCEGCKQKFDKIMKAWEVLGNQEKRKAYDQNRGFISELKSNSVTLTPDNYQYLVEESNHLWVIQVYDSTNNYARFFSQFWQQIIQEYGDIIKFGRVDVWFQSNMLSYIPYKFQVFPGIYIIDKGYPDLCSFDFEKPMLSLRNCIEKHYEDYSLEKKRLEDYVSGSKPSVFLHPKLKTSLRAKAISKIYENDINFYYEQLQNVPTKRYATLVKKAKSKERQQISFSFKDNSKKYFNQYNKFLQSSILQEFSICKFLNSCEDQKCFIILNKTNSGTIELPFSEDPNYFYPTIVIKEEGVLEGEIKRIKNITDLYENFEIGLYEGGKIDLGYLNQVSELDAEAGQFSELKCERKSFLMALRAHLSQLGKHVGIQF